MKFTKNFYHNELTASATALRRGIDNTPTAAAWENMERLCKNVLQPLRDELGSVITVTSGYRSPDLCVAIGSKRTSQHTTGCAADIEAFSMSTGELYERIKNSELEYDQLILEFHDPNARNSGWVHVSHKESGNRREAFSIGC